MVILQTSQYSTVKVLLRISSQGVISFISNTWGGRVSDKYITKHCGILNYLTPGNIILADRGFDILDSISLMQAQLHIPEKDKHNCLH